VLDYCRFSTNDYSIYQVRENKFPMEPMEIEDMPHMARFVYEFYKANEPALVEIYAKMQAPVDVWVFFGEFSSRNLI